MHRASLIILSLLLALSGFALELTQVPCGTVLSFRAEPRPGYHFVGWSDGETDAERLLQVMSDTLIVALFESNCGMQADLPVVARYDWLLMLNVKEVRQMGYRVEESLVRWYRVVGEPDDISDPDALRDDQYMTTGFYLTIDRNLAGTGDYYCVLEGDVVDGGLCTGAMRSVLVHYSSALAPARQLRLLPNLTSRGQPIRLVGLDPDIETDVRIFSVSGKRMAEYMHVRAEELWLPDAVNIQGCYEVCVYEGSELTVLRYIVQ